MWALLDASEEAEAKRVEEAGKRYGEEVARMAREYGLENEMDPGWDINVVAPPGPRPVTHYGMTFEHVDAWLVYKNSLLDFYREVHENVLGLIKDDFYRLRWSPDHILEMDPGHNTANRFDDSLASGKRWVSFRPVWLDDLTFREAYWSAFRRSEGYSPEAPWAADWDLDFDRMYRDMCDGSFFPKDSEHAKGMHHRLARPEIEALLLSDEIMPCDQPAQKYWTRISERGGSMEDEGV